MTAKLTDAQREVALRVLQDILPGCGTMIVSNGDFIEFAAHFLAAQLCNEKLREALEVVAIAPLVNDYGLPKYGISVSEMKLVQKALSTQPDISALEAERQRVAEACGKVCRNPDGRDVYGFATAVEAGQWKDHIK